MAPTLEDGPDTNEPTVTSNASNDHANGAVPDPPIRYGKPLPKEWIPLYQKPIRTPTRKLRVVTIGGGVSAMGLAYKFHHEHKIDDIIEHTIYEANDDVGGTWLVNRYPGVAW